MKRFAAMAIGAFTLLACSDGYGPTSLESPSYTITMPGNVSECGTIDFASCFAKVDAQFKVLYERNNALSRRGEVQYNTASDANVELATVFLNVTYTTAEAITNLDRFIRDVERGLSQGRYSECGATQVIARANWLKTKLQTLSVDMSDPPPFDCEVSPVGLSATGTVAAGVTLTVSDPWHYTQDVNGTGHHTYVNFVVERQSGAGWDAVTTTATTEQFGATTFTIQDPTNTVPGSYVYRVFQCDTVYGCSAPTEVSVTIADPSTGGGDGCPHDNRNGKKDLVEKVKGPKCEKDDKEPKDHKNK